MIIGKDGRHFVVFLTPDGAHLMPAFWYWWTDPLFQMEQLYGRWPAIRDVDTGDSGG
jgi:hypothetical protein